MHAHPTQTDWRDDAACRDTVTNSDHDPFFEPDETRETPLSAARRELAALAVCEDCPVRVQCLEYAVTSGQAHGVWGGRSEVQVRVLVAQAGTRPAPVENGSTRGAPSGARHHQAANTHCRQGHPDNAENTYVTSEGKRQCRTCTRTRLAAAQTRRRELAWVETSRTRRTA
jgi:WhiB family redox-sensing transcriptional regulator